GRIYAADGATVAGGNSTLAEELDRMGLARLELKIPGDNQIKLFESLGSRDSIGAAGCGKTARPLTTGTGIP
ncbi:MAG TPA: hypothetical protein DCY27_10575, partial [Desulfobacterales bacterium]|nr:hypothetical protein [Desulfobacterales bacterium]